VPFSRFIYVNNNNQLGTGRQWQKESMIWPREIPPKNIQQRYKRRFNGKSKLESELPVEICAKRGRRDGECVFGNSICF